MPGWLTSASDLPRALLMGAVRAYRLLLSPWLGSACRFEPTCSAYALQALERHGALVGSSLTAWRLLRCHPWCAGGCEPVPTQAPRLFTTLLGNRSTGSAASADAKRPPLTPYPQEPLP